jgi:hypothetical protein
MSEKNTVNNLEKMRPSKDYHSVLSLRESDAKKFYEVFSSKFVDVDCPACNQKRTPTFKK